MKLSKGFTILETIIVLGILVTIFALGIPVTFNFYVNYELVTERDNLVSVLNYTRSQSMTGEGGDSHGIFLESDGYVVFEGPNYVSRSTQFDRDISRVDLVQVTGPSELVFESLSGRSVSSSFTLSNGIRSFVVNVNAEGLVTWEL